MWLDRSCIRTTFTARPEPLDEAEIFECIFMQEVWRKPSIQIGPGLVVARKRGRGGAGLEEDDLAGKEPAINKLVSLSLVLVRHVYEGRSVDNAAKVEVIARGVERTHVLDDGFGGAIFV